MPSPPRIQQALPELIVISSDEDSAGGGGSGNSSASNSPGGTYRQRGPIRLGATSDTPPPRSRNTPLPTTETSNRTSGSPPRSDAKLPGYHGDDSRRALILGSPPGDIHTGIVVAIVDDDNLFFVEAHQVDTKGHPIAFENWYHPAYTRVNRYGPVVDLTIDQVELLPVWQGYDMDGLMLKIGNIMDGTEDSDKLIMIHHVPRDDEI